MTLPGATVLKLRGGTTAQHAVFTGVEKEVTIDTDKNTPVVHDGQTPGGHRVLMQESSPTANAVPYWDSTSLTFKTDRGVYQTATGLGVGITSPLSITHIKGVSGNPSTSGTATNAVLRVDSTYNSVLDIGQYSSSPYSMYIQSADRSNLAQTYDLVLQPVGGNVGVNNSAPAGLLEIGNFSSTGATEGKLITQAGRLTQISAQGTATQNLMAFYNINGLGGSISIANSTTSYSTASDYRLKADDVDITDALTRVGALRPIRFNFKADPSHTVDGFFAHEAQEVVPECATGEKDATEVEEYEVTPAVYEVDEETGEKVLVTEAVMGEREVPVYQGLDQAKLVPLLTAAIQELDAKVNTLTERLETA